MSIPRGCGLQTGHTRFDMKLAGYLTIAAGLAVCEPAAAETLQPAYTVVAPSGHQKAWHVALDLRSLPQDTRPARIGVTVDARLSDQVRDMPRVTVAINGIVIARARTKRGVPTRIETAIEDRLVSTRNHVTIAITSLAETCRANACDVASAMLDGPIRLDLAPATAGPVTFAQWVTRFRKGVAVKFVDPRDRALGERAIAALAPRAPRRAAGPAEIVVSTALPKGVTAPLRFDSGAVAIKDRDGRVLYDGGRLAELTLVQMARRGTAPVLWVRPGTQPLAAVPLELDYGSVALFGSRGREIAFSPDQDHAVTITYADDARRAAQTALYWRLAIAASWLAVTAGLVLVLRRMAPLNRPQAA